MKGNYNQIFSEILINFKCYQCQRGSTCLQNEDDILLYFSIKDCIPIRTDVLSNVEDMDSIFRCDHRQNLKYNKLTQSLIIPLKLNKFEEK